MQQVEQEEEHVTQRNNKYNHKKTRYELRRRELLATRIVQTEVKANNTVDRYGYVPTLKDTNNFRLMYENCNSLGVFAGDDKITHLNKLVR